MRNRLQVIAATTVVIAAGTANAADLMVKAPPPAPMPEATGYVELYTGWAQTKSTDTFCETGFPCDSFSERLDGWVLGGAARANYWWATNASVQLDAQAEGTSYSLPQPQTGHFSDHSYLIGAHVSWRDPQRGLIGVFGGAGDAQRAPVSNRGESERHGLIGIEGQLYLSALTLYGQAGYDSTIGNINNGIDGFHAWFLRGTGRYYILPNLRLEGTVLYADGSYDLNSATGLTAIDFKTWFWRAKAEYKIANSPFSLFAAYEGSRTTTDIAQGSFAISHDRVTDNRVLGGIRLYLGEKTLWWNDTNGTTLDIISPFNVPSFIFGHGAPI